MIIGLWPDENEVGQGVMKRKNINIFFCEMITVTHKNLPLRSQNKSLQFASVSGNDYGNKRRISMESSLGASVKVRD